MRSGARREAAAAPATVSGEFHAETPLDHSVREGGGERDPSASQETCFGTACCARRAGCPEAFHTAAQAAGGCTARGDAPVANTFGPGSSPAEPVVDLTDPESAVTQIFVCKTCRTEGEPSLPLEARAGARLCARLQDASAGDPTVVIVPVECLSVCHRACSVALSGPGKWTYIYGDLPPEAGAALILDTARLYAATSDGLIPWKQRAEAIKKGVVARLPPTPPSLMKAPA